ncbi:MAG: ABC transporter ATP-binding protein [Ectothiorhodospiraceae bacterium]|nr:ABC transporter ATP-binding protein [Chromatiales bacterium]MCP5154953.1 ABC transporter ATP-binding protein [Ectothiorhodospiraceae bacterium]
MAFTHRWRMALAIVSTVIAGLAQIVIPGLIGQAVDHAQGLLGDAAVATAQVRAALWQTAWLLVAAAAVRGVSTMTQNYQGEAVGHLIAHEMRLAYYRKLQRLSFSWHDRVHTGELMTRGILDIEGTRLWVHTGILRMVLLLVLIGGGSAYLVDVDPVVGALALAFVPFVGVGATVARLKLRRLWFALQEELGVLTRVMEENLGGIRVVRAFAAQGFEMARFDVISRRALGIAHRRIAVFVKSTTTMTYAFFLSMTLVLWVGGERVIAGHITVGELTAILAFMTILQQPVRQIAWMVNSIARASTCGGRLFEILDLEPAIRDAPGARPLEAPVGVLRFENVSFSYHAPADGPPAGTADAEVPATLAGVSFEVGPGKVLGIVGPPGSGKSTIAHLIPRFYDVTAGTITIDGTDIREVTLDSLRAAVSVIQQDAFLFSSAIEANVAYADPWADRSAIRQATETAQLHQYVSQLPDGYGTLVGERGVSLSGGQRQRLAIARGILPQSRVIVFDDSMAAVDAGTERRIREELAEFTGSRATIIIAHRLSSLRHADEILFLEAGRVVERGDHAALIASGGRYAELHALQTDPLGHTVGPGTQERES